MLFSIASVTEAQMGGEGRGGERRGGGEKREREKGEI